MSKHISLGVVILCLALTAAMIGLVGYIFYLDINASTLAAWFQKGFLSPLQKTVRETFLSPVFFAAVGLILLLELRFPVNPRQKILSLGFAEDFMWFMLRGVFEVNVILIYVGFLKSLYKTHVPFLTVDSIALLPDWINFLWGILLADFLAWLHHYIKHKVPWFWHFHVIHHSQKELNMFTDFRYHFVEYLVSRTVETIPLLMLNVGTPSIAIYFTLKSWYTRFYHGNIRTNLGWLKHILITPQSHRIHHSIERQHRDKNFGVLFNFWDRIFKTLHKNYDEYPVTGVEDPHFPHEQLSKGVKILFIPLAQLVYPFQAIARSLKKKTE